MEKSITSDFMFTLADKYGIAYAYDNYKHITDEEYNGYMKEYAEYSRKRDDALKAYLLANPDKARTFVPWRGPVLETTLQIQWYYDELVLHDPVYIQLFHLNKESIEDNKYQLTALLNGMKKLRESMQSGFLLFGSYDGFNQGLELSTNKFEDFFSLTEVQEECALIPEWYEMEVPENAKGSYSSIRGFYRNMQSMFFVLNNEEAIKENAIGGLHFNFVGEHRHLSAEDLRSRQLLVRCYESFKAEYHVEVADTLRYLEMAPKIQTPMLFDRKLDELIVALLAKEQKLSNSMGRDCYGLFLPYVDGIPAERLLDLRNKMPNAFLDFRNAMFEIIYDLKSSGVEGNALELKIRRKIDPIIKSLDVEIKNTLTKTKIIGIGGALMPAVGSLSLTAFGIDPTHYAGLLAGGVALTELGSLASYLTDKRKQEANDFYYLWKARQGLYNS